MILMYKVAIDQMILVMSEYLREGVPKGTTGCEESASRSSSPGLHSLGCGRPVLLAQV